MDKILRATVIFAWLTHVIFRLQTASWGFLIAGALIFLIGIIYGIMVWVGAA